MLVEVRPPKPAPYLTMALIALTTFGLYYAFDLPGALPAEFTSLSGGSTYQFELLYMAYTLPNCVLPLLAGRLADSGLGPWRATLMAVVLVGLGRATDPFSQTSRSMPTVNADSLG